MMIIDRFEDDYAVIEFDGQEKNIAVKRNLIPKEAREGDVITELDGIYEIDIKTTYKRRQAIIEKTKKFRL